LLYTTNIPEIREHDFADSRCSLELPVLAKLFDIEGVRLLGDMALRRLEVVDRCFRGVYCLHHQGDDCPSSP
jgi:hypothetical protein